MSPLRLRKWTPDRVCSVVSPQRTTVSTIAMARAAILWSGGNGPGRGDPTPGTLAPSRRSASAITRLSRPCSRNAESAVAFPSPRGPARLTARPPSLP